MTTTVTIKHGGPDVMDIKIVSTGNVNPTGTFLLTKPGQEFQGYFWQGGSFTITEEEKQND